MLKINNFLNNIGSYQKAGAKALGLEPQVEHNFEIGSVSMMQAVLGIVTLGIGILIGVVVFNAISTALPAPAAGTPLLVLFDAVTTQFAAAITIGLVVLIVSMAALVLKVIKDI